MLEKGRKPASGLARELGITCHIFDLEGEKTGILFLNFPPRISRQHFIS
jgi:hypothetical protein